MPSIPARFTAFLAELRIAVAAHAARDWARTAIFNLLFSRLGRIARRFESLFTRWQAGRLPKPRPSRAGRPTTARERPPFPRRRAWLLAEPEIFRLAAAVARYRIEHLFAEPDMAAFLQATPQAGRLLRPLCHMLGIDLPPPLRLPPRPRKPRPRTPSAAPAEPPLRPLPTYVRAAVRAWRHRTA